MLKYIKRNKHETPFPRPADMPEALHRLLVARGISSAEEAETFLHPEAKALRDPFLLSDMAAAVARIRAAIEKRETICVYGDYDVDGVCATAIVKLWLDGQGADARAYLPSRHTEGYGLNEGAIREIATWAKLLLTVDCGVTSVALVALAKSLGLSVVVTDHHRPGEALPDCPVVNPLLNGYPFPGLCGAGVAWKLVWALSGRMPRETIDIAALATVADVVPLTDENRVIVALGLKRINAAPRPGVAALQEAAAMTGKPVTATGIAFQLAPRLNAGGRLGSAMRALNLMLADDPGEARALAEALDQENTERRNVERKILAEAEARLRDFDFIAHRAIILSGADWNPGVIGLAASRLVEQYHYPVVLLADQGEKLTGSCRSIEGVDIHAALTGCAETLLKFGGHRQAAGLTLEPGRLQDFIDAMDRWLAANVPPQAWVPVKPYDAEIDLSEVTPGFIASLDALQPTGFGNPAPVFRAGVEVVEARPVGLNGAHLRLTVARDNHRVGGIAFREGHRAAALLAGSGSRRCLWDALFVPKIDHYMGRMLPQLEVQALSDADANARIASNLGDDWALQCEFLTEILYNKKITPLKPESVDWDALARWLADSPQGTLIAAGDMASAAAVLEYLSGDCAPDLYLGRLPTDPRAFNALCVCPVGGKVPRGYRRVALAGAPAEWADGAVEAYSLPLRPAWADGLPDLDAMRRVYRAMADLATRPVCFHSLRQLAHLVADYAGVGNVAALASIAAMEDMGLFRVALDAKPERIMRTRVRKVDPEGSRVWRMVQGWRNVNG